MNLKLIRLYIIVSILFVSCYDAPNYPDTPEIVIKGVRAHSVVSPGDSVIVVLEFQDGNGDLGKLNNSDTIPNLFITDKRFGIIDSQSYSIPYIPDKGSVKDISGEIEINLLSKIYCNPLYPEKIKDTLEFEIQVRDRAGNFSNKVTTGKLEMNCR